MAEQNGATTPKKEPTASEAMFFFAIVKHTRNKADIDCDAVVVEQNFKSTEMAKVRFGQVKRKLGISSTAETPSSSARASGKKRDNSLAATPTKVTKKTGRVGGKGRGRSKVKSEPLVEEEPDNGDEPFVKDETVEPGEDGKGEFFDPPSQFEEEMRALGKREEYV